MATVLVIEDNPDIRFAVSRALRRKEHTVTEAETGDAALAQLGESRFDLVITDLQLPDASGIDLIKAAHASSGACGVMVMTAYGSIETAVAAMKAGADDYLQKPLSLEELVLIADRLIERCHARRREQIEARTAVSVDDRPMGESPAWVAVLAMAERYATLPLVNRHEDLDTAQGGALPIVLITGETGSGKGAVASFLHRCASGDAGTQPFVHLNCSSLPSQLVESELFGHVKGAFTDARETREGLVEMADGGTLFLDEIGDMAPEAQGKLLLFLDSGRFRRVGGDRDRTARCRVIAATNRELLGPGERPFRKDLYYRLSAFRLGLPPLRDRDRDAVEIARAMLTRFRAEYRLPPCSLSIEAERALAEYDWPGNVRELINVIQRAAMLCEGDTIGVSDLTLDAASDAAMAEEHRLEFDFCRGPHTASDVERELVIQALRFTDGNVAQAARLIGMQRSSLRLRIEKYGLESSTNGAAQ